MLKFFAISKSELMAKAVAKAVTLRYSPDDGQVFPVFPKGADAAKKEPLELFRPLFEAIEKEIKKGDLVHDRFIGILDLPDISRAEKIHVFTSFQGMLILAFPEIQWIPLYRGATLWHDLDDERVMSLDRAVTLCNGGYSPLFDGDGLRSVLLERAHAGKYDPEHLRYSRTDVAVSIDEETSFAAMNAYTAYRFGYRAFPVSTKAVMDDLLGARENQAGDSFPFARGMAPPPKPRIVAFEDICIEFPDANKDYNEKKIAFGNRRAENYPVLKNVDLCVFTTSAGDDEKVSERHETLAAYMKSVGRQKPLFSQTSWVKDKISYFHRFLFNSTGGFWPGFWAINLCEIVATLTMLIVSFFVWPMVFPVILLLVFIVYGVFRQRIHMLIFKSLRFIPGLCKLIRCREQWVFMPKCYENHFPVSFDSGEKYWERAHKPLAGIFGFRNKCRLPNGRNYSLLFRSEEIRKRYKTVLRTPSAFSEDRMDVNGHSSPGVALELATLLLRRAERMKSTIIDAEGAVHAAVLANVAVELLNYKTPSVSIEAFKWKHYYEVLAECEFVGVRANLDMKERYIDIHNGMERICRSESTGKVREIVFISAMSELVDQLAKLLGEKSKVEEASYFWTHSRRLHRKLMLPFTRSLFAYPEWVLRDKWHFIASLGLFFAVFLAYCIYHKLPFPEKSTWTDSFVMAYQVMIARANTSVSTSPKDQFIVLLARQIAMLHIGFVATHIFVFMNRK